jgi:site-specific DNA recombinase
MNNRIPETIRQFSFSAPNSHFKNSNCCVIYTRVSTLEQARGNSSLETQKKYIEQYAEKNGYIIKQRFGGTFESAKEDERKEFKKMVDYTKKDKSISAILVYSYDRFSRSGVNAAFLAEELQKSGTRLIAVSQEVDTSSPTGKFQQNIMLMFSQFDNELRKDKVVKGMIENIRQGYWVGHLPFGYSNENRKEKARFHKYIINKDGELLKLGFKWRAEGKMTDLEIVQKLNKLGCKIKYKSFNRIIENPFYCGFIRHSLTPGEIFKGHHPPLITEELFLRANKIVVNNPLRGIPKKFKDEDLPLKRFAKDEVSLSPFTGYTQKGIRYYKTTLKHSCVNVKANHLHTLFISELKKYEIGKPYISRLEDSISKLLEDSIRSARSEKDSLLRIKKETIDKQEALEEKYISGEIERNLFEKYRTKYQNTIQEIDAKIDNPMYNSSNFKKAIFKGVEMASNLSQLWLSSDYNNKQLLQYLLFPEGLLYSKENDGVRTPRVNGLFQAIPLLSRVSEENKNGRLFKNGQNSHWVVPTGIEPVSKV